MQRNLYERLGGYDSISAVIDDFMQRQFTDKQVGRFYVGHSTNSKKSNCSITSGNQKYN